MSSGTVKIGLAGCGWIAENGHVPAFNAVNNAKITSVFDIDINRALRLAATVGIKQVFDDYQGFLDSGLDAVIVTTPNCTHAKYTMEAIKNGKHVLCEKPFTVNSCETEEIFRAARENNRVVLPGFVSRFRNDIKTIRELALANVGQINSIEAGWIRKAGVPRPGTWFTCKEMSGGGVLIDLGSHIIDICLMLSGLKEIKDISLLTYYRLANNSEVSAQWFKSDYEKNFSIDVEDTAFADIEFVDNSKMQVNLSWLAPVKGDFTYFHINGDEGAVELKTLFGFSNQKLWQDDKITIRKGNKVETLFLNALNNKTVDAFQNMAEFFINKIIDGNDIRYLTFEDGYNTVKLIERLYSCEKIGNPNMDVFRKGYERLA